MKQELSVTSKEKTGKTLDFGGRGQNKRGGKAKKKGLCVLRVGCCDIAKGAEGSKTARIRLEKMCTSAQYAD